MARLLPGPSGPQVVPFGREGSRRALLAIFALIAFLGTVALGAAMALDGAAARFADVPRAGLTLEIPAGESEAAEGDQAAAPARRALALLRATPGIADVRQLTREETVALIEPWLGKEALSPELPLPSLIDIALEPGGGFDRATLQAALATSLPEAELFDAADYLAPLAHFLRTLELGAAVVLALIALAAGAAAALATRMGLSLHGDVIELLHLFGASDLYVARLFERRAAWIAGLGATLGAAPGAAALIGLGAASAALDTSLLPPLVMPPWGWALVAALPPVLALLSLLSARFAARARLRRLG